MSSYFNNMKTRTFGALMLTAASLVPSIAAAQDVVLKSSDGTVNLSGEFIEFVDGSYLIRTALGDMRISATRVFCEGEACPKFDTTEADVVFAGSDTVGEGLMPLLVSGYAAFLDGDAEITNTGNDGEVLVDIVSDGGFGDDIASFLVNSASSSDAFEKLLDESAQVGMSSRRIRKEEARELRAAGAGNMVDVNQEHVVAVDSLVVIVNQENPLERISIEELQRIYSGEVTNWSEVGGPDLPIKVYNRNEDSGTRGVFEDRIFQDSDIVIGESQEVVGSNNDMAAAINADPSAIGFVGYAFQRGAKPLSLINECGIASEPDPFASKTEEYSLQRRLYLYNKAEVSDETRSFIDYSISSAADVVVAKSGFIDLGIKRRSQDLAGNRANDLINSTNDPFELGYMRELLAEMQQYDRLSTTFRFATGSTKLDAKARLDLARLVDYLEDQPAETEVLLVGFTDDVGAFEANYELSAGRAALVVDQIKDFAGGRLENVKFSARGFGQLAPAACNTSENGKRINRRVEVWIRSNA